MTAKRYFKRMWEEEYYIFDSKTISEKEFDEKVEYEDYQAFADSLNGDEVVKLLNVLNDKNDQLRIAKDNIQKQHSYELIKKLEYKSELIDLKKENEELKKHIDDITVAVEVETCKVMDNVIELIDKKIKEAETEWENADFSEGCKNASMKIGLYEDLKKRLKE